MSTPESSSNSTTGAWLKFFADAGVPQDVRHVYTAAFMENRIERGLLKELNKEMLQDMGIKPMGDIIVILRHIRELSNEELLERSAAGAGGGSANVAKVRPQASVAAGDHGKKPITPTARGGEAPGSVSSQSAVRLLRKVPRTNARQIPLPRNQKTQATGVGQAPGNSGLGAKKTNVGTGVKVGQNTPSSVSKPAGLTSGTSVKLGQVPRASSARSVGDSVDDVGLEASSRGEQDVRDSISVTVSKERETDASSRQNTDVPATPVKRVITCSRSTPNPSPKLKQVSRGGKKSVLGSKTASVRCAPSIPGSKKVPMKSILKKDGSLGKMNGTKCGQVIANVAGPITTNFVSCTKSPYSGDGMRVVEGPATEETNFLGSAVAYEGHAAQNVGMKQRVVCKPVSLPVDDSDDADSLTSEEETGSSELVTQESDVDVNTVQGAPVSMQVTRLVSHHTSGAGVAAGGSAAGPAAQKNIVSLRTVKYGCEPEALPVKKVRRIPPGHEGKYTIIMPKGRTPSRQAAVEEENYDGEYGSFVGDEEGGEHYVDYGGEVDDEELYDEELDEDAVVNDELELTFGELPGGNVTFEDLPGGNVTFEDLPGGNVTFEDLPGGNVTFEDLPRGNVTFEELPGGNVPSVFERLGWKYRGHHRGGRFRGFGMYSGSFRHFRNTRQRGSVFSRLNPDKLGLAFNGLYRTRYVRGAHQPWKHITAGNNSRAPETQISSRQLVVGQKGWSGMTDLPLTRTASASNYPSVIHVDRSVPAPAAAHQPTTSNVRLNYPAETVNMDLSAAPTKKSVRFGTKEELCFSDTIKVAETPRRQFVGSITLKSGVFDKLGT